MITLSKVTKIYKSKSGETTALKEVFVKFADTGLNFILGKSGCGKSTLLNLIGGLDRPTSGTILIAGQNSSEFSESEMDAFRNTGVGFVFQEYNLMENHTVGFNVNLALELLGEKADRQRAEQLLRKLQLVDEDGETLYDRYVNELSGGQKQRVAIARALVKNPKVILADEPTGALDSETGRELYLLLKEISAYKTVIVVTHDRKGAEEFGDRIIELSDGRIISDTADEVSAEKSKDIEYKKSRLPFQRILLLGAEGIKAGPVRFLLTVLLIVTTLVVFGFSYSANYCDENSTFIRTMYAHDYSVTIFTKRGGFSTAEYDEIVEYNGGDDPIRVFSGRDIFVDGDISENNNLGESQPAILNMNNPYISAGYSHFFDDNYAEIPPQMKEETLSLTVDERFEDKSLCRMPNDLEEIAITDMIFDVYQRCGHVTDQGEYSEIRTPDDMIGKTINGFRVCGVYSTEINCDLLRAYDHDNYGMTERDVALGNQYELEEPAHSYFNGARDSIVSCFFVKAGFTEYHEGRKDAPVGRCIVKLSGDFNKDYKLLSDLDSNDGNTLFTPNSLVTFLVSAATIWMHPVTQKIISVATVILAVFSVLLMLNCLLASIEHRKRELGVLRAIGAGAKDLIKICLIESVISSGIGFTIGTVGAIILCYLANVYYFVNIFSLNIAAVVFMFLLSVGFSASATILAALKISRKKPIEILNGI